MAAPRAFIVSLIFLVLTVGCRLENRSAGAANESPVANAGTEATVYGSQDPAPTDVDVEAARRDSSWRGFAMRNTDYPGAEPESAADTGSARANVERPVRADTSAYVAALQLPLGGGTEGRAVLYTQILLDRARFSPGQIDGKWGQNTEKALYWLQRREGLDATGRLDRATLRQLLQLADAPARPESLLVVHRLTSDDVEGPFVDIPDDVYAQAEMERLGYGSLAEKLGEAYHVAPVLLREWHGRSLDGLAAGDTLRVPNLRSHRDLRGIDRIVVSDGGRYLHALDARGRIVYHVPATLGADYDPSPSDTLEIVSITDYPGWHYQPSILADVDDAEEDAHIPPGPNNAVGVVWMKLSKEHYGIHGTAHPATIGHTASAGCVRLTNWDAQTLATHVGAGTEVAFRDTDGRERQPVASADTTVVMRP